MKRFLRDTFSALSYQALRLTNGHRRGVRMLTYHRVTDAHPADRLCVPMARFREQMAYLKREGYQTVAVAQIARWVTGEATLPARAVAITFDDGFADNFLNAYPVLARHGFRACFFVPTAFIESGQTTRQPAEDRPMSWGQLAELLRDHQEVGAHSVTHRKLAMLTEDEAREEVRHSKDGLEQQLKRPVTLFCYPAGSYNAAVKQAVQDCGYVGACSVEPGANHRGTDPYVLKRTEISAFDSLWDLEKKLAGAYDWLHGLVQGAKRFSRQRECANAMGPQ
jgi:peptidoglycan/xylan/chitin deacetylase (PgdA/CDA1 family)